jgi:acyl-CoA synthetase (AMP-forming)/AMP-acid ligase II
MLTHANFLSNVEACSSLFAIGPEDQCLSFLPLSHVFERMAGYYFMLRQGAVIAYAENFDSVPANLAEVRPTVVISVPALRRCMQCWNGPRRTAVEKAAFLRPLGQAPWSKGWRRTGWRPAAKNGRPRPQSGFRAPARAPGG